MTSVTFMHAADIHLARPFAGLLRSSPELGGLFRRAGYQAWERMVSVAMERQVDFVVLAGDVFDSPNPPVRGRVSFRAGVEALHAAGIPVFLALGNHDPLRSFPEALRSLPGLHLFGPDPTLPGSGSVEATQGIVISGASFETAAVTENLVRRFRRDQGIDLAIGVVHANIAGSTGHVDYAPASLDDLLAVGMDVWCLGHVHTAQVLRRDPLISYSGATQGANPNEVGPKGCYLVSVSDRGDASIDFLPLAAVRWEKVRLDVTDLKSIDELLPVVEETCSQLPIEDGIEAVVVRMALTGVASDSLREQLRTEDDFMDMLSERLSTLPVSVIPGSLEDTTRATAGLDSLANEEGFLADFIKMCHDAAENPEAMTDLVQEIRNELARRVGGKHAEQAVSLLLATNGGSELPNLVQEAAKLATDTFFELLSPRSTR
ncbi:MAG: DNA repair exonuclease [Desulfomonile tiedjei]|nr:DNA repair exonuclease [Desulfomonile tiedjei]